MVAVVQLVEHQIVILDVAGSSPVSHPEVAGPEPYGSGPVSFPGPLLTDGSATDRNDPGRRSASRVVRGLASSQVARQLLDVHQAVPSSALPAFQVSQGMFQSPRPSQPGNVPPPVPVTSKMSPRLALS